MSSKFESFIQKFNSQNLTNYSLDGVIVDSKNKKWVINISLQKDFSNVCYLETLEKEIFDFVLKKSDDLIKDLKHDIRFLFSELKDYHDKKFWLKIFKYLFEKISIKIMNKIIPFLDEEIDFEKKIFRINLKTNDKDELKPLINDFAKLLKKDYNFDLDYDIEEIKLQVDNDKMYLTFSDIPFHSSQFLEFKEKYGSKSFWIQGYIQNVTKKETKNKKVLFSFHLLNPYTKDDSIFYKQFCDPKDTNYQKIEKDFQEGTKIEILSSWSRLSENSFIKNDFFLQIHFKNNDSKKYNILSPILLNEERIDDFEGKKRIELHLHTKMSNLDSINSPKDYIETAQRWGHKAIAFTDYNGLYAYPDINKCIYNKDIKPILGIEMDFISEKPIFVTNQNEYPEFDNFVLKQHNYVVFDIETTGFSKTRDRIIEISAIKIENGQITDKIFDELIDPQIKLNKQIIELTQIQDEDLKNKPTIEEILPKFLKFIEGYVLVAHNYSFDIGFIKEKVKQLNIPFKDPIYIDTLYLAQKYFSEFLKYFKLKRIAKVFKVKNDLIEGNHHRALFDSKTTALALIEMFKKLEERNILHFYDLKESLNNIFERTHNVNILVKNQKGYQNLFRLVSDALTENFYKKPRLLKSIFEKYREGLLIGSGSYEGNIFEAALNQTDEELKRNISFYDYIEIQPLNCYKHIMYDLNPENEDESKKIIQEIILKIIKEAQKQNKIIVATGDVHYLNDYDKMYREIYINAKLVGGGVHKLSKYDSKNLPDNYLLTTQEMLDSFKFIEDKKLREDLVIHNTHLINDQIEKIKIFPSQLFSLKDNEFAKNLKIPSIKEEIKKIFEKELNKKYGNKLHPFVQKRTEKELKSIIGDKINKKNNNIAPIYFLAHLLAKKSIDNGYPVGSRGSIGSSLVATLLGITEVNPLKPHYLCSKCQYTVFTQMNETEKEDENFKEYINNYNKNKIKDNNDYENIKNVLSGYDLPNMDCPFCKEKFTKDGQDIPFETFLGFEGDKIPDIDLNFSGDYQSRAHEHMKELLGKDSVFKAGTIQTVAQKTAFGYVKGFIKDKGLEDEIRVCEIARRANMIEGVKRSTGQHPGGIIVVPKNKSIYEITPIQFPANDIESNWKTTHFDYHSFENNLFKMDILGHDDPILIKFFMDYVKKNPEKFPFSSYQNIPVDDPKVYDLFPNETKTETTTAIPEFGTEFVKQMLKDIYKKETKKFNFNFGTLVKISGLSHGTDVWLQNARDILNKKGDFSYLGNSSKDESKEISFNDIIGCRDDIMLHLIKKNVNPLKSFEIMEIVRKGQQNKNPKEWNKTISEIKENTEVSNWYLESLNKIKYLFPKAHAAAYVLMAVRIAWFKVYHPLLFYSCIFSKRLNQFDYKIMLKKPESIDKEIEKITKKKEKNTVLEQSLINTLNVASEMLKRGFKFSPIDLNKSQAFDFIIDGDEKSLIMPFITIDGLGEVAANNIVEERKKKSFTQEDFYKRVKINKTVYKIIKDELKLIEQLPL
ncbi:DNA polymerase III subunit alpha, Gram-positive type [Candidatus Phytoplasma luffae]|uniref:DNA polymerase III PolC-type n=1 Tax=Loofah witches'-broom phytoplasma TaxID=35773 RepID=A0A975FK41_LOWBP|nr:exonuclease domain-containing protein [Candidatus Phytoplasma luffae]QTX02833.1 DNA polymerase III subunit alpha, Gram-positive type [Candidatus Phytoplasma luffae]